jgi:pyridoxine 4-dehydrogenase
VKQPGLTRSGIQIYQFHRPDPAVPFEDSVGELARLLQAGKIRHVGLSNVTIEPLAQAQKIVPIVSVQSHYNLGATICPFRCCHC